MNTRIKQNKISDITEYNAYTAEHLRNFHSGDVFLFIHPKSTAQYSEVYVTKISLHVPAAIISVTKPQTLLVSTKYPFKNTTFCRFLVNVSTNFRFF